MKSLNQGPSGQIIRQDLRVEDSLVIDGDMIERFFFFFGGECILLTILF